MRNIEFKAIATEEVHTHHECIEIGEFVYGYILPYNKMLVQMSQESGGVGSGLVWVEVEIDKNTVGQYIGFNDVHKNKVFDGDIINLPDVLRGDAPIRFAVVKWVENKIYCEALDNKTIYGSMYISMSGIVNNIHTYNVANKV